MKAFLCGIIFLSMSVYSQTAPSLRTARPAKTIGVRVVGTNVLQHQFGTLFTEESSTEQSSFELLNTVRFGISERLELSVVANFKYLDAETFNLSGLSNTQAGFRVNLFNAPKAFIRGAAFQYRLKLPLESRDFKSSGTRGTAIWSFTQNLYSSWGLRYNLGFNEVDNDFNYNYSVNLTKRFNHKLLAFIETYGDFEGDRDRLYLNVGASYLIRTNLQFDFNIGRGKTLGAYQSFAGIGFTWRMMP